VIDGFALVSTDRLDVGYAIGSFDGSKVGIIDGVPLGSTVGKTVGSCVSKVVGTIEENTVLLNEGYDEGFSLGTTPKNGTIDGVIDRFAFGTNDWLDAGVIGSSDGSDMGSVGKTIGSSIGKEVGTMEGKKEPINEGLVGTTDGSLGDALGKMKGALDRTIDDNGFSIGSNDRLDVGYAIGSFDGSKVGIIDGVPLGSTFDKTVGSCVSKVVGTIEENTVLLNEGYDEGFSLGTTDGPLGAILGKNNASIDGVTDGLAFGTKDGLDVEYALGSFGGSKVGSAGKTVESCVDNVVGTIEG
jgi:hypothetical protein